MFNSFFKKTSRVVVNGKSYTGRSVVVRDEKVIIDGVEQTSQSIGHHVTVEIHGDCNTVENAAGNITIHGDVKKNASTDSGDLTCGNVGGSAISMSGDIECGDVRGGVQTMSGDVRMKK